MSDNMQTTQAAQMDPAVSELLQSYPQDVQARLMFLRDLIYQVAAEAGIDSLQETLKWGQPSYLAKGGSTTRIDWDKSSPEHYAMYFHCQSKLVDTFKELYKESFSFQGNRALVFNLGQEVPVEQLKHCIYLALTYHSRKHLPLLGV